MLGIFGSIVAMVLWVGGTLVTFLLIHTFWPPTHRRSHNEIVGWQMSVIGTTYAVILGFMLYNVWDNFRTADLNADQEANALVSIYRLADGLPDSSKKKSKPLRAATPQSLSKKNGRTCPGVPSARLVLP